MLYLSIYNNFTKSQFIVIPVNYISNQSTVRMMRINDAQNIVDKRSERTHRKLHYIRIKLFLNKAAIKLITCTTPTLHQITRPLNAMLVLAANVASRILTSHSILLFCCRQLLLRTNRFCFWHNKFGLLGKGRHEVNHISIVDLYPCGGTQLCS